MQGKEIIVIIVLLAAAAISALVFLKRKDIGLRIIDISPLGDGFSTFTVVWPREKKVKMRPGEILNIKIRSGDKEVLHRYAPMRSTAHTVKFLIRTSLESGSAKCCLQEWVMDFWKQKQVGSFLLASRPKNNFKYYGSGRIKATFYDNRPVLKTYKKIFILAQGEKISAAYNMAHHITQEEHPDRRPQLHALLVSQTEEECPLRGDFKQLQQINPNFVCEFSDWKAVEEHLRKWARQEGKEAFYMVSVEDRCGAILCEKVLEEQVPHTRVFRVC